MSSYTFETATTPVIRSNESFTNSSETPPVPDGCVELPVSNFTPWNNPYDLLSLQVEATFDLMVVVVLYVFGLISLPANILNMIVFFKLGLKERINLCLFFLSLSDLCYMVVALLIYCDRIYLELANLSRRGPVYTFVVNYKLTVLFAAQWTSEYMTMVISCERCFCVVSPLRSQRILKTKTMLVVILLAFATIFAIFGITVTRWSVTCVYNPETGLAVEEVYLGKFYLQNRELVDAMDGVMGIGFLFTFFCIIVTSTTITVLKLRHFTAWRQGQASVTSAAALTVRDVNVTRMLVGCSVLFVVTNIPQLAQKVGVLVFPEFNIGKRYHNTYNFVASFVELCNYVNFTFNFFIYFSMGTKYKETLQVMCSRKKDKGA